MAPVAEVRATAVNVPMVAPYRFSFGTMASFTSTVVEVVDSDGVVGLGEAPHGDLTATVTALGARLVGLEPDRLNEAERRCVPDIGFSAWTDAAATRRAFGALEMAMWDLRAQRAGVPLVEVLGGRVRDRVAFTEYFALRIGCDRTPAEVVDRCARLAADDGVRCFEGKVGVLPPDDELAMLAGIVGEIGHGSVLRVDANGGYTVPTARTVIPRLAALGVAWLEDPCRTLDEAERLRADGAPISFSTHEPDLGRAARRGVPDGFCVDVSELGGFRRAQDFVRTCAALGIDCWCYSGDAGIMTAAYLHLTGAEASLTRPHQSLFRFTADLVVEQGPYRPVGGELDVPTAPGLGVTLDRAALARLHERYRTEGALSSGDDTGYGGAFRRW